MISIDRFEELEHKVTLLMGVATSLQTHVSENREFIRRLSGSCVREAEDTMTLHDLIKATAVDIIALRMELEALRQDLGRSKCQRSTSNILIAPTVCSGIDAWTVPWGFVR